MSHQWHPPASTPLGSDGGAAALPWALSTFGPRPAITRDEHGRPVGVPGKFIGASSELELSSAMVLPLVDNNRLLGALTVGTHNGRGPWTAPAMAEAQLLTQVVANALSRRRSGTRSSRASRSVGDPRLALSEIAVLDRHGRIIGINASWGASVEDAQLAGIAALPSVTIARVVAEDRRRRAGQSEFLVSGLESVLRGAGDRLPASSFSAPLTDRIAGMRCRWCRSAAPRAGRSSARWTSRRGGDRRWRSVACTWSSPRWRGSPPWANLHLPRPSNQPAARRDHGQRPGRAPAAGDAAAGHPAVPPDRGGHRRGRGARLGCRRPHARNDTRVNSRRPASTSMRWPATSSGSSAATR